MPRTIRDAIDLTVEQQGMIHLARAFAMREIRPRAAAVQTHGGWGYSREFPVEKWLWDAKLEEMEEGTSDIQRLVISRRLMGPA